MMQTKQELLMYITEYPDNCTMYYNANDNYLYEKRSNRKIATLDKFWETYSKKYGLSFECLYDDKAYYSSVLRCNACGTVIFYLYDEKHELEFACPTCTEHKTNYEFWTKADIDNDKIKHDIIESYIDIGKAEAERQRRINKRHGKRDDQLLVHNLNLGKYRYKINLRCKDVMLNPIRGLLLTIEKWENGDNDNTQDVFVTEHRIPLGLSAFKSELKLRHLMRRLSKEGDANHDIA